MTEFQEKVYAIVKKIPRGQVLTYQKIAVRLGNSKLTRAVGNTLSKNFNPKVPCHRVIRTDGQIGGYNRGSLNKIRLLKKEGIKISRRGTWVKMVKR